MKVANEAQLVEAVQDARASKTAFEIVANGTKRAFGRPPKDERLDVSALSGIRNYEPEELIVTVGAGTPIAEIEALLAEKGQRLGFDPQEWAPLFGPAGTSTIGGAVSVDQCGSARVRYGGPRDQLLGLRGVNGFGEAFAGGGRVVKNVTGFDIPKLVCGAFGTLCVLTELTFRVFPKPECEAVLAVRGVTPEVGLAALRTVWSSPLEATGLAYVPTDARTGASLIRLEGARGPLDEKIAHVRRLLTVHDVVLAEEDFSAIGRGALFEGTGRDLWRVHVPPAQAASVASKFGSARWFADWAGALIWLELEAGSATALRETVDRADGHAILMRASEDVRTRVPVFPAEPPALAAITRSVKAAFDPLSLVNPGRMYEGI
jgi:glycolate oxidase FAD binding subunit